jgi:signal peptidase I, bacterial type
MGTHKSLARIVFEPLAVAIVGALLLRALVHAYSIPSPSMEPALLTGDHILVTRIVRSLGGAPGRGDVVVFRLDGDGDDLFVKRVVGVPGDRIEIRGSNVFVNGKALEENYLAQHVDNGSLPSFTMPAGRYFLLGDNREHSLDSRSFGPVDGALIVGKARLIFWSSTNLQSTPENPALASSGSATPPEPPSRGVRWNRVFHLIH